MQKKFKQIKVAWICHFSSEEIRARLPLSRKKRYADFSSWISTLAGEFDKREDIDLHIIAPHRGLKKMTYILRLNNITYHFFKPDMPFIHKSWASLFSIDQWTFYTQNRVLVRRLLKKIKPDLVNLHGAENPYYSVTALDIKKIPVLVTIQGIYSNSERFNQNERPVAHRIDVERAIHRQCQYFGIFPPFFADLIKRDNDNPIFFRQSYIPNTAISIVHGSKKKYDFVYFGRITDVKGVDKIIEAVALINSSGRSVTLNIIGSFENSYKIYLQELIKRLKIGDMVFFSGYLPTFQAVNEKVLESKVTVISSRFENLPGTIIESVLLGQPVAATAVGGIPYLNKDGQTILLSQYGDVEGLANNMLTLLDNPEYAARLTEKCRKFILKEFNAETLVNRYISQYRAVIEHFHHNTPIPEELLFSQALFEANP